MKSEKHQSEHRLLLIDDDEDMIAIGEQVFAKAGYKFISASSGQQGLEALLQHQPEIAIIDYLLPDMKGEEIIKRIAGEGKYAAVRNTPFVILTAWEESLDDIDRLYQCGLKAYLTKPFGHRELRCVVDNVVALSRIERQQALLKAGKETEAMALDDEAVDLIRSIVGLSRQLVEGTEGDLSEQQSLDLTAIYNSGMKLLRKTEVGTMQRHDNEPGKKTFEHENRGHA